MQAVDRERVPAVESLKGREIAPRQAVAGQLWPLAVRSPHPAVAGRGAAK